MDLKSWQAVKNEVGDEILAASLLPERPTDAHKGTFGTALVVAGSVNYTGAALLAGKAAYRIGAGSGYAGCSSTTSHLPWLDISPKRPGCSCRMKWVPFASAAADVLTDNLERVTSLLIGPGLGLDDTTREFIAKLAERRNLQKSPHAHMGFVQAAGAKGETETCCAPTVGFRC